MIFLTLQDLGQDFIQTIGSYKTRTRPSARLPRTRRVRLTAFNPADDSEVLVTPEGTSNTVWVDPQTLSRI